jgi:hypothetical protein
VRLIQDDVIDLVRATLSRNDQLSTKIANESQRSSPSWSAYSSVAQQYQLIIDYVLG